MRAHTTQMMPIPITMIIASIICSIAIPTGAKGGNYNNVMTLLRDKLNGDNYDTDLRPVVDQSNQMVASVSFSLVGIVEVDDVTQKFTVNGYFVFKWTDEIIRWDPSHYGGVDYIHITPSRIWRPRMVLVNSMDDGDPFSDDGSSTKLYADGSVVWNPGGIFLTSCQLNMEKYPFDTQSCHLMMCVMHYHKEDLQLRTLSEQAVSQHFIWENKGWTLDDVTLEVRDTALDNSSHITSCLYIKVRVERRPTFYAITILFPLVFMSFLNCVVFLIPIDSQERISYAITVLLAISVTMGTVSTMVPQASDVMPAITIYLFILLIEACLTVFATIGIEYLHDHCKNDKLASDAVHQQERDVQNVNAIKPSDLSCSPANGVEIQATKTQSRLIWWKFRRALVRSPDNVNKACFVIITLIWCIVSIWYLGIVLA